MIWTIIVFILFNFPGLKNSLTMVIIWFFQPDIHRLIVYQIGYAWLYYLDTKTGWISDLIRKSLVECLPTIPFGFSSVREKTNSGGGSDNQSLTNFVSPWWRGICIKLKDIFSTFTSHDMRSIPLTLRRMQIFLHNKCFISSFLGQFLADHHNRKVRSKTTRLLVTMHWQGI